MRRLILPTCLLMFAWAPAAGPRLENVPAENLANVTVVEKTPLADSEAGSAPAPPEAPRAQIPAETTEQVMTLGAEAAAPNLETPAQAEAVEAPLVPLPPRRAIPHNIVCQELALAATDNDLPAPFLIKLINQESGFNQNAVSRVGAQGVAQFMPETAAQMRLSDPFDPLKALHASAQLLRSLFEQFGKNLGLAAAAYNAGPRRVQDWLDKRGKLPQETRDYVQRITGHAAEQWKARSVAAQMRVPASAPCQREAGLFASNGPATIPLPQTHPGSEAAVQLAAHHAKRASHRMAAAGNAPIVVASADPNTSIGPSKSGKPQQTAKQPNGKPKTATVAITAKRNGKTGKGRKLQVVEARGQK
jgi:hypothetical protein